MLPTVDDWWETGPCRYMPFITCLASDVWQQTGTPCPDEVRKWVMFLVFWTQHDVWFLAVALQPVRVTLITVCRVGADVSVLSM